MKPCRRCRGPLPVPREAAVGLRIALANSEQQAAGALASLAHGTLAREVRAYLGLLDGLCPSCSVGQVLPRRSA